MKTIKFKYLLPCALLGMMLGVASCVNDLDTVPLDKDELVSDVVFGNEPLAYEQSLAKIYAGMAIGGNSGGDSDQDVVGIDGGCLRTLHTVHGMTPVSLSSTISPGVHPVRGSRVHITACSIKSM